MSYHIIHELLGKTLIEISGEVGCEEVRMTTSDGEEYCMNHPQDCCECVYVQDIIGNLQDLVGSPLIQAEESTNTSDAPAEPFECPVSYTWTFYKFATAKGFVTLRWFGTSNGYYGESVDINKITN